MANSLVGCSHIWELINKAHNDPNMDSIRGIGLFINNNLKRIDCDYIYSESRGLEIGGKIRTKETCFMVSSHKLTCFCTKCENGNIKLGRVRQVELAKSIIKKENRSKRMIITLRAVPCTYLSICLWNNEIIGSSADEIKGVLSNGIIGNGAIVQTGYSYYKNSCYLNSIMQALISCDPYIDSMTRVRISSPLSTMNTSIQDELLRRIRSTVLPGTASAHSKRFQDLVKRFCDDQEHQVVDDVMMRLIGVSLSIAVDCSIINNRDCFVSDMSDETKQDSVGSFLLNDAIIIRSGWYCKSSVLPGSVLVRANNEYRKIIEEKSISIIESNGEYPVAEPGVASFLQVYGEDINMSEPVYIKYGDSKRGLWGLAKFRIRSALLSLNGGQDELGYGKGHIKCISRQVSNGIAQWVLFDDNTQKVLKTPDANKLVSANTEQYTNNNGHHKDDYEFYTNDYEKSVHLMMVDDSYCQTEEKVYSSINDGKTDSFISNPTDTKAITFYYCARNMMNSYIDYHVSNLPYNELVAECTIISTRIRQYKKEYENEFTGNEWKKKTNSILFSEIFDIPYTNPDHSLNVPSSGALMPSDRYGMRNAACRLVAIASLCGYIKKATQWDGNFFSKYRFRDLLPNAKIGGYVDEAIVHGSIVDVLLDSYVFTTACGGKLYIRGIALLSK